MTPKNLRQSYIQARATGGQTLAEYALILAFISVVAISTLLAMGGQTTGVYSTINRQLINAEDGGSATAARH